MKIEIDKFYTITETGYRLMHPLVVNEKDGSVLVEIPAGEFEMGDGDGYRPKHLVYLDRYYIGVYAVTNRQYKRFVDETGHRPPAENYGWKGKSYLEVYGDHPVVQLSWEDAQAYCRWARVSLPTEAQWEKAARGPGNFKYPWGNDWNEALCRHSRNRGSETTAPVYAYPQGVSGYGLYNTSGNVVEFCQDWHDLGGRPYYKSSPKENPKGPSKGYHRVVRGGTGFNSFSSCRSTDRGTCGMSNRCNTFSFRVVLAPGQKG